MTADQPISTVLQAVSDFARARDWGQFHDPKSLALALASEAGELCALLRWVPADAADVLAMQEPLRTQLREELGDVAIVIFLLCNRLGIDPAEAVAMKLKLNERKYPADRSRGRAHPPSEVPERAER